tara:strand:- start:1995 stop:2216 length:222 start_codon:yes stop_codon:yes gene_type:complete
MIRKTSKFFCVLPLLFALAMTGLVMPIPADDQPPNDIPKSKEESKECIEKIKRKQARIKEEMRKIKKMIKRNR